jgi:transcriptional regulator with XRE-family HTH domain
MNESVSGRTPSEFSREFARRLNGLIGESSKKVTGQQIAKALNRNDGYVSERKNGKRSWTIDDIDGIAELLDLTGIDALAIIVERIEDQREGALVSDLERARRRKSSESATTVDESDLADERSAAQGDPKKDVEGESEGETP